MFLKQYSILLFIVISGVVTAQTERWRPPTHQITASIGRNQSTINEVKMTGGGLAYTFHFAKRWWASAEWQTGYKSRAWQAYEVWDANSFDPVSQTYTANITQLPAYQRSGLPYDLASETIIADVPMVKLPANGFYENRNYGLLIGYMITTPKNVLRFGAGISMTETRQRLIRFMPRQEAPHYLLELTNRKPCYNAALQYDYYLWRGFSVGMRLMGTVEMQIPEPSHYSALISIGYGLTDFKKKKAGV
jgi:hypothetical protein